MTLLQSEGKAALIRSVADEWPDHRVFVETGSACADLPLALQDRFDRIVTIERDDEYYASAANRMLPYPHVQVIHADSAEVLGDVLAEVGPAVIWLDAHEISDEPQSALKAELVHIAHASDKHVVLIDDSRFMADARGWVSPEGLIEWARHYGYEFEGISSDVARLYPPRSES